MRIPATSLPALCAGAVVGITALALTLAARPSPTVSSANHGRCVGMFLDTGGAGSRVPRSVPAEATNLTVSGTVPCKDSVMAWAAQGPYRVFEDGTVEFLAAPVPPCQGGDYYVWIGFPK
jgi:hypothetical protein